MTRLTAQRCNGIKSGYWSPAKKEDLCQRLGKYEDTGMEPEEIRATRWIPVTEKMPEHGHNVLFCTNTGNVSEGVKGAFGWVGFRWGVKYSDNMVTHWMPLPEAPEVGH